MGRPFFVFFKINFINEFGEEHILRAVAFNL